MALSKRRANQLRRELKYNKGILVAIAALILITLISIFAFLSPYDPDALDMTARLNGPSASHWFGTDDLGRDTLSRILAGARVSLLVGISATAFATLLGVSVGLIAGYVGGALDGLLMRICDIQLTFPSILVALLVDGVVRAALPREVHDQIAIFVVIFAIGISEWPKFARTVRGSTLVERNKEYVQAARVIGVPKLRIMATHVLPNVIGPVLVVATLNLGLAILSEATLSFLGVGVPPTQP